MKNFIILGATGSIGSQTLDVIKENEECSLLGFSFGENLEGAIQIIEEFKPLYVCCKTEQNLNLLRNRFPNLTYLLGNVGLVTLATIDDDNIVLVNALVGSVGLSPSYEAVKMGRDLYLANKETLVIGGSLIMPLAKKMGAKVIPIDSEHSAIYQLLKGQKHSEINKLYITASGGAFRDLSLDELKNVKSIDALKHPNWQMGKKITIDCATMMNKGFELIEAHYLFDIPMENIVPLLHRESTIHSLVEFKDHSIFAQMATPDMRLPIEYAIFENHINHCQDVLPFDFSNGLVLNFKPVDEKRYPLVGLAKEIIHKGGYYPTILNASNEAAVHLFLNDQISFLDIEKIIKLEINNPDYHQYHEMELSVDKILELDQLIKNKYHFN